MKRKRLLYIVTTAREYNNGRRGTQLGSDRFALTLLPTLSESLGSLAQDFDVTLLVLSHFEIAESREDQLRHELSSIPLVDIEVWNEATPMGYPSEMRNETVVILQPIPRALARQHRYVIKDRLLDFDVFVNFEDDMIVRSSHVHQYLDISEKLDRARADAPKRNRHHNLKSQQEDFWGPLTKTHYSKLIPGWIRVEAGLPGWKPHKENILSQVPLTFDFEGDVEKLNSTYCCHVSRKTAQTTKHTPEKPSSDNLYFWETSLDALSVRKLSSDIGWVVMLAGNYLSNTMGSYWSGQDGYFKEPPLLHKGRYANNQGGWMATQKQIFDWHLNHCAGGFLPPFDGKRFKQDGLIQHSVEAWSGGGQIVGQQACRLQRIIPLDPRGFEKHLLYHSSNNKQRASNVRYRFSSRSIQEFWAQLNTVRSNAEQVMNILAKQYERKGLSIFNN